MQFKNCFDCTMCSYSRCKWPHLSSYTNICFCEIPWLCESGQSKCFWHLTYLILCFLWSTPSELCNLLRINMQLVKASSAENTSYISLICRHIFHTLNLVWYCKAGHMQRKLVAWNRFHKLDSVVFNRKCHSVKFEVTHGVA